MRMLLLRDMLISMETIAMLQRLQPVMCMFIQRTTVNNGLQVVRDPTKIKPGTCKMNNEVNLHPYNQGKAVLASRVNYT